MRVYKQKPANYLVKWNFFLVEEDNHCKTFSIGFQKPWRMHLLYFEYYNYVDEYSSKNVDFDLTILGVSIEYHNFKSK